MKTINVIAFAFLFILCLNFVSAFSWSDGTIVSYYNLDQSSGNALDSLGINNATTNNITYSITGKINTAYNFTIEKNSYINITDGTLFHTGNLSWAMWVRTKTISTPQMLIGTNTAYSDYGGLQMLDNGKLNLGLNISSGWIELASNISIGDGNWHYVVATYNGSVASIYIDGQINGSYDKAGTAQFLNEGVWIGAKSSTPKPFNGTIDEVGFWNRGLTSDDITILYNAGVGLPFGNFGFILSPVNYYNSTSKTINFSINNTVASNVNITNISLFDNSTGSMIVKNISVLSGKNNTETVNFLNNYVLGSYLWKAQACYTDNTCLNSSTLQFSIVTNQTYNTSTYETARETFSISAPGMTTASLVYDGTTYPVIVSGEYASKSIDVPAVSVATNKSFYWNINGGTYLTTEINQTVNPIIFVACNAIYNVQYLNVTFRNETLGQQSVSSSLSSTFIFYLGSGTVTKSYTFTNTSENTNYSFCASPVDRTFYVSQTAIYSNSYSDQRTYTNSSLILTNISTNQTLWLLPSSDRLFVSFQVITASNVQITGATIVISRTGYGVIESKLTDSSGVATFALNPLFQYTVQAFKTGYGSSSQSITPTQTSYSIVLGTGAITSPNDYGAGVGFSFYPTQDSLVANTIYEFNFTISSAKWILDNFGFNVTKEDGTLIGSAYTSGSSSGTITTNIDTTNCSIITFTKYWTINGTLIIVQKKYPVYGGNGTEFSIWRFLDDFKNYVSDQNDTDGLFGLKQSDTNNLNLNIFMFIVIFIITGIISYALAVQSPLIIALMVTFLTFVFEVTLSLIKVIDTTFPIATFICGIITLIIGIREVYYG